MMPITMVKYAHRIDIAGRSSTSYGAELFPIHPPPRPSALLDLALSTVLGRSERANWV